MKKKRLSRNKWSPKITAKWRGTDLVLKIENGWQFNVLSEDKNIIKLTPMNVLQARVAKHEDIPQPIEIQFLQCTDDDRCMCRYCRWYKT